jgi:hypothetical protein
VLSAGQICGLLAEPERRAVVAAMVLGATDFDDIATTAGLDAKAAVDALDRLERGGLVDSHDQTWILLAEAFKVAAVASRDVESVDEFPEAPSDDAARVLQRSIVDGRLVHWPAKRSKRLVVLDHLAQLFEPGRRYSERQVNARLAEITDDPATMRRYLVDERFLDRADGEYWRSGGTV